LLRRISFIVSYFPQHLYFQIILLFPGSETRSGTQETLGGGAQTMQYELLVPSFIAQAAASLLQGALPLAIGTLFLKPLRWFQSRTSLRLRLPPIRLMSVMQYLL
jgi:hypothetical protein